MQLLKNTKINFLGLKWVSLTLSLIAFSVFLGFMIINGLNLGIDFIGGNLIHLKFQENPNIDEVRTKLAEAGYADALIQQDEAHNEIMIRVQKEEAAEIPEGEEATEQVSDPKTLENIIDALRSEEAHALADAGKLDLNIKGRVHFVEMLMAADPLEYLKSEPNTMTPEAYAEQEYQKLAHELIEVYRDKEFSETKAIGIISNLDEAIASMNPPHHAEELAQAVRDNCFIGNFSTLRAEMVSATVGSELGEKAIWAIVFSWVVSLFTSGSALTTVSQLQQLLLWFMTLSSPWASSPLWVVSSTCPSLLQF